MRTACISAQTGDPISFEVQYGRGYTVVDEYVTAAPDPQDGMFRPVQVLVVDTRPETARPVPFLPLEAFR